MFAFCFVLLVNISILLQYMMFNKYYIYQMENGIRYAKIVLEQNKPK